MYLKNINIEGYKGISGPVDIPLHCGLNVIVGENSSGKTTIIDAVRLLLREDEFGYTPVSGADFYNPIKKNVNTASFFRLSAQFGDLLPVEQIAFLPWSDLNGRASLTLQVDNKENKGRYKRHVWGGVSKASIFEWELFDAIDCIYLPPLRDAEAKLREGKASRLARLLKNLATSEKKKAEGKDDIHDLEVKFKTFNTALADDKNGAIAKANKLIKTRLHEAVGDVFCQDTNIQFSEVSFNRIVESLRLFFFPDINGPEESEDYRSLEENSLGYNNLLYLATVLAELIDAPESQEYLKVLLVEEPEAHLHPQLQIRLLKYLEKTAKEKNVQVIVTTHSTVLASSASVSTIIHLSSKNGNLQVTPLSDTGLDIVKSENFINRWLDATKSTLLFAKGIILVEGIAESFLIPEFAKKTLKEHNKSLSGENKLPETLEDAGVSVINMNGIYFKHFMQLFCNLHKDTASKKSIPVRCAGITDLDPAKKINIDGEEEPSKPTPKNPLNGENHALELIGDIKKSENCRLYASPLKTLEYDLAFEDNNIQLMAKVLSDNWATDRSVKAELLTLSNNDWSKENDEIIKAKAAYKILIRIEDSKSMGKGYFAQLLAEKINEGSDISIPEYIKKAIIWACGRGSDES